MRKIKLSISGMHCGSCAGNIERSLRKVSGVKEVSVSAITNKAFVEADEKTSEDEMKKAVARAGYKIISVEEN
ncbi:MAG: heavy metal-associated domain-containing protein [Nanoarchaeota archaeon]